MMNKGAINVVAREIASQFRTDRLTCVSESVRRDIVLAATFRTCATNAQAYGSRTEVDVRDVRAIAEKAMAIITQVESFWG